MTDTKRNFNFCHVTLPQWRGAAFVDAPRRAQRSVGPAGRRRREEASTAAPAAGEQPVAAAAWREEHATLHTYIRARGAAAALHSQQDRMMEQWSSAMSLLWSLMGLVAFLRSVVPAEVLAAMEQRRQLLLERWWKVEQTVEVHEMCGHSPNELYSCVHLYLGTLKLSADTMRAECPRSTNPKINLALASGQGVKDTFQGHNIRWQHSVERITLSHVTEDRRHYLLTVPKAAGSDLIDAYLEHVLQQGRKMELRDRDKELHTNVEEWWESVPFSPPATFETLGLEADTKQLVLDDLSAFKDNGGYYSSVGKAWKRGYLLYGPPGTGKTTLIGAMANFTGYDVYDLELTKVKSNTQLRQLLMNIKDRAIIVIEDIDCTAQVANRDAAAEEDHHAQDDGITLSGLLNFTDGLWSSCGKERIFVFTTNYLDKLDPALVRPGRMDMRICMSYCSFTMFKSLAPIYLKVRDDEAEDCYYPQIEQLLKEIQATPADITETLARHRGNTRQALANLVEHLQQVKQNPPKSEKQVQKEVKQNPLDTSGAPDTSTSAAN